MKIDINSELEYIYVESSYPAGFSDGYDIMECLAEKDGVDTFLVQDKAGIKYVAKCYDRKKWSIQNTIDILSDLEGYGIPKFHGTYENEEMIVTVREYIEGIPLDRYAAENEMSESDIVDIMLKLCDILIILHHRSEPVIHRDIKPKNIIVGPDKNVSLIDFDIARIYHRENDTDTTFFGTVAYAPPEQYGFSQTDSRTDIYSLGIVLRFLLTGSPRENKNIRVYRPLDKIIDKCTAFSPKDRFGDIDKVKTALLHANPGFQRLKTAGIIIIVIAAVTAAVFAGKAIYERVTYDPFSADAIPAFVSDEERIADAVDYMKEKYDTDMFDDYDEVATMGDLRKAVIKLYGLDEDYVYAFNEDIPQESDEFFFPWGYGDEQLLDRDIAVYAAVKLHDPSIVADWSSLEDDTGEYPGSRVALAFAEEHGILEGANRPDDITLGDLALILSNTDRVFESAAQD